VAHEPTIREVTTKNTHATVAALLWQEPGCRRVLDIPCGEGAFVNRIRAAGYEVHAADVQALLKVAGVPFTHADMSAPLPFANDSFDAVVCIDGIEHIERPFDFVRECRRILRPGGVLLLSTPNISALRSRWRWLLTGFHNKGKTPLDETAPNPWHHIGLMSFPEIRYLLHSNGFRITAIAANRVKVVSWLYALLWPLAWLVTGLVFRRWEKDPAMRRRHAEVRRQLYSVPVALGETLVVKAACAKLGTVRRSTA
jgi:2-polyprenyl-3-methyl-5-hydroxy-6-metoxy-1,4-benzoquinol methylase